MRMGGAKAAKSILSVWRNDLAWRPSMVRGPGRPFSPAGPASRSFRQTIPLSTLDILLGDRFAGKRMVIKMDVEGAEYGALLGASRALHAVPRPTWLVEITLFEHRQGGRNPDFVKTFELFWNLGYTACTVGPQTRELSPSQIEVCLDGGATGLANWELSGPQCG